jgi:Uma2 family endonuclease
MTMLVDKIVARTPKRWTKREYNDLVDRGLLRGRVFLYRGEILEMPAMGSLHRFGVTNVNDWLNDTFRPEYRVQIQLPFECPDESEPEPDAAVVTHEQMARLPHPNRAVLVIEVSDSSLEEDQEMAFDYASADVPDYWILNMRDRQIEVFRDPVTDPSSPTGRRYAWHQTFNEADSISPLARPDVRLKVAALLKTT